MGGGEIFAGDTIGEGDDFSDFDEHFFVTWGKGKTT